MMGLMPAIKKRNTVKPMYSQAQPVTPQPKPMRPQQPTAAPTATGLMPVAARAPSAAPTPVAKPPAPAAPAPAAGNGLGRPPAAPGDPTYVGYEDNTATLVNDMAQQDSLLMQQAATSGMQTSNDRGMMNSSMAAGASQAATLDYIVPIASQDASQNYNKNMAGTQNQQERDMARFDSRTQKSLQKTQIMADSYEAELDRELQLTQQASDQAFQGSQLASQQEFEDSQRAAQEAFEASQIKLAQEFESGEAQSDRDLQAELAANQQEFEAQQAQAAQDFAAQQSDLDRELQYSLTVSQQAFEASQLQAQQDFEASLNQSGQDFDKQMAEFEAQQLEEQREFQAQQAELDRQIQAALAEMDLAAGDQAAATALMTDAWSDYNQMYAQILANPDLSAEERQAQIKTNQEMLDDRITYTTELYGSTFDWPENVWDTNPAGPTGTVSGAGTTPAAGNSVTSVSPPRVV